MIKITNLNFVYEALLERKQIFRELELELHGGHIYGLLGLNGSGKSTLLKLLSGMLIPDKGEVKILDKEASHRLPSVMAEISYLPEEIYTPQMTMKAYAQLMSPFYPNFSHPNLLRYMGEFEIEMGIKLSSMSLGQKKKAAIAFALACNTKVLIMDEPTNGLDIPSKSQFRKVLSSISGDERVIVISTHQVRDLESLIDTVMILNESEIIVNASIETIANCLSFRKLHECEEAIYEESSLLGRYGVVENQDGEESRVDMELLFNASVAQSAQIKNLLTL
ncbi:MAG: ABC transporter ATP-binding protein [Rikenellaceae bacterium]